MILADPTKIHQIMINVCTNAAHAMREKGGKLSVSLDDVYLDGWEIRQFSGLTPGEHLRITISDTGHGMNESTLERIFDPFFTTKGVGEGSGMGLPVVHGIVKSHKGAIDVSSVPGKGTTFKIYFPIIQSVPQLQVQAPKVEETGTERVLFVDDDELTVAVVKDLLENLSYKVAAETSSLKALETFRGNPENFDLIITDFTMPLMTGNDLASEIKRIRPDIPVILCTGSSDKNMEEDAIAKGVSAFVLKPLGIQEFSTAIRRVLNK
jgi:CheY-like chemotaxis protein